MEKGTVIKVICTNTGAATSGWGDLKTKLYTSRFAAVYDSNPESENGKFFAYTPQADISFGATTTQPFEVNKEYYVIFSPVEES